MTNIMDPIKVIRQLKAEGYPDQKIGNILNISRQRIHQLRKKHKIETTFKTDPRRNLPRMEYVQVEGDYLTTATGNIDWDSTYISFA